MATRRFSIDFTDSAYEFARDLVAAGEYATISAAVSGELARAKAQRAGGEAALVAEVERRATLAPERWEPVGDAGGITAATRRKLGAQHAPKDG